MKVLVHTFLKERDHKTGERLGAGCRRACSGCKEDEATLWIGETPPDFLRGKDKAHKSKRHLKVLKEAREWEAQ